MPILIVNNSESPQGLVLGERVLIGRRPFNTVMVPDPTVSRIHAWIGRRDGRYVLFDAGSRAGTSVNAEAVTTPRVLSDGDEIRVGPATLTYMEGDDLPADVAPLDPPPAPPAADPYDGGIYFDCACGGPMWVTMDLAGRAGRCRYCGERLVVPHVSGQMARPLAPAGGAMAAPAPRRVTAGAQAVTAGRPAVAAITPPPEPQASLCSICQTPILASEEKTSCPSCHLTFHTGCWQENYGCSAYGCDQVNVLAPQEDAAASDNGTAGALASSLGYAAGAAAASAGDGHAFPWESVLLALSFVATALGAIAFGVPSAIMLIWTAAFLLRGRPRRKSLVIAAMAVAVIGITAGYATSMFWWKGVRVWETFLK